MENEEQMFTLTASAVSVAEEALEHNEVFLVIRFRLLDDTANLNREGVTKAFIDDIVQRQDKLLGLPLYCDVNRLLMRDYGCLGHMYDRETGEFHSTQIGSITSFEKSEDEGVSAVIATARVPKREHEICDRLIELYDTNSLKFSFEIRYDPAHMVEIDGVRFVDAYEKNVLAGVSVVSVPAFPESCALEMVAEAEQVQGDEPTMTIEEAMASIAQKDEEMAAKDQMIAELNAQIQEMNNKIGEMTAEHEKYVAEAEEKEKAEEAEDEKKPEEDTSVAGCNDNEAEMQNLKAEIERLRAEVDAGNAAKAELETIKAEQAAREHEAQVETAKAFAEKNGLDMTDTAVAEAVTNLDYRAIIEMTMAQAEAEAANVAVASFVNDGFELKGGQWDDLLAPAN